MSWASGYVRRLREGETVTFRPRGGSMAPRIKSGQEVTVAPLEEDALLVVGDVVLVKVSRYTYLHLIKALRGQGEGKRYQIGNNKGRINGWVGRSAIYGKLKE